MQFCLLNFFEASPQTPPKWGPKKLIFLIAQARVIVFLFLLVGIQATNSLT